MLLAAHLLEDAVQDITACGNGRNADMKKRAALNFFFSKESEKHLDYWTGILQTTPEYFRSHLQKYKP